MVTFIFFGGEFTIIMIWHCYVRSFQNRLDQAVSGALDLWKQTQGQEATHPSQDLDANSTAVSAMLERAQEEWGARHQEEKEVTRKVSGRG